MSGVSPAETNRDLAYALSSHIAGAKFADLDEDTVTTTKLSIIDTIGVSLASTGLTPGTYHGIKATYAGTANYNGSNSSDTVTLTVS